MGLSLQLAAELQLSKIQYPWNLRILALGCYSTVTEILLRPEFSSFELSYFS